MRRLQITIDDGPQADVTGITPLTKILAELKKRSVIAAFFVIGQEVKADLAATKLILKERHLLGNHSWDHLPPNKRYSSEELKKQFLETHDEVLAKANYVMSHWRVPRGDPEYIRMLTTSLTSGAKPLYQNSHCDWHGDSKDALENTTADQMLASIREGLAFWSRIDKPRLLFHVTDHTSKQLPAVLDALIKEGYSFINFEQNS